MRFSSISYRVKNCCIIFKKTICTLIIKEKKYEQRETGVISPEEGNL